MTTPAPASVTAAVLGPLLRGDAHRPRLTWYSADGDRTELSTASLANWSAKVAGLLSDELGAAPGDTVAVLLPAGWQTLPVLLGAWWAGCAVTDEDDPDAVAAFVPDGADPALGAADEVFVVSGHPFGLPSQSVAVHQRDFAGSVLPQADRYPGRSVGPNAPAVHGSAELSVGELVAAAEGRLTGLRALVHATWPLTADGLGALLGPLLADGSIVAVDPRASAEQAEHWASTENVG